MNSSQKETTQTSQKETPQTTQHQSNNPTKASGDSQQTAGPGITAGATASSGGHHKDLSHDIQLGQEKVVPELGQGQQSGLIADSHPSEERHILQQTQGGHVGRQGNQLAAQMAAGTCRQSSQTGYHPRQMSYHTQSSQTGAAMGAPMDKPKYQEQSVHQMDPSNKYNTNRGAV
jgi:hypothetical protein